MALFFANQEQILKSWFPITTVGFRDSKTAIFVGTSESQPCRTSIYLLARAPTGQLSVLSHLPVVCNESTFLPKCPYVF